MAVGTALMYYVGARQVLWRSHLGRLDRLRELSSHAYQPLEQLSYTACWRARRRARALFRGPRSRDDVPDAPNARAIQGRNEISNFRMSASVTPVTDSFGKYQPQVHPWGNCGLCRRNGSRQEHLLSLVPRFYDPTSGAVLLDECDLRELTKNLFVPKSEWSCRTPSFQRTSKKT